MKKLLSGNSFLKVISWKYKPIFTEIILLLKRQKRQNTIPYGQRHIPYGQRHIPYDQRQFHMVKGIINAFDHMKFCLVINLTMGGNWAVTWPPIIVTRYVSFASTLNSSMSCRCPYKKCSGLKHLTEDPDYRCTRCQGTARPLEGRPQREV